ncbi:MAG TPA: BMP family ABC transporter substrate-binding protein [Thermoanaerobacterales bacterium]|nr:BMP family ABC transporter substrate-binding protein [Thermoanaerobacterales bacterium]
MKRFLAVCLSVVMVFCLFTGCATKGEKAPEGEKPAASEKAPEKKKVALLCDVAGTQVFVLSMINGLKDSAEKYGFEPIVTECADAAAYEDNARALVEEGVDLIIGGGWLSGEAINKIATEFPDAADYALIDSEVEAANVKCISYREQEGAYLVGKIAAYVTDENDKTFGSVHVNQGAGSWKWRYGYMEGVKSIKPDAKFIFNYTGNYNDPAKAKEFAIQQYEQGCKFVNGAAAGGDKGVFEAAKEKGFYTSGQDVDLTTPDNPYIVTSQIKDTYATVSYLVEKYFTEGEWIVDNETWGLKEGTIGAVHVTHESKNPITDRLLADEIEALKQAAEDIKNGKLNLANMPNEENYK